MKLLLDTHVLLGLAEPQIYPLPGALYDGLDDARMELFVSNASLWEVAIKNRLGKLPLSAPLDRWAEVLKSIEVDAIDIRIAHIVTEPAPMPDTKDPFDRLIVATAIVEQCRLVTIDKALRDLPIAWRP